MLLIMASISGVSLKCQPLPGRWEIVIVSSDCRPHHLLGDLKSFCCQDMRNISIRHSLLKVKLYDLLLTVNRQKSLFSATETKESIEKASIARSND